MHSGSMKGTAFITLVDQILRQRSRGRIVFTLRDNTKTLFFDNHAVTGASSSDPSDYLGQYLVNEGAINLEQFNRAYQAQLETDVQMAQVLQLIGLAPAEKLRETIIVKIVDTAFIVSCWQDGNWEVDETYPKAVSGVEVRLDIKELSAQLVRRQGDFAQILEMFNDLGDRPEVVMEGMDRDRLKKLDQQIISFLAIGKTLRETLKAIPVHFYVLTRHLLSLYRDRVIRHGDGAPIAEAEIFERLVTASGVTRPQDADIVASEEIAGVFRKAQEAMGKKDYWKAASFYRMLCTVNPNNLVFKESLNNAEYHYVLHFYKEKFRPTAQIKKGSAAAAGRGDPIEKKILDLLGDHTYVVRDLVGFFSDKFTEIKILNALENLARRGALVEAK